MQRRTADGGLTTTSENVDHTIHPCVPHSREISCEQARIAYLLSKHTVKPAARRLPENATKNSR